MPTNFRWEVPNIDFESESLAPFASTCLSATSEAARSCDPIASVSMTTFFRLASSPSAVAFMAPSVTAPMMMNSVAMHSENILSALGSSKGSIHRFWSMIWSFCFRISLGRSVHPSAAKQT